MKCQICGKEQATIRYYENINGKKQEMHLCAHCAQKSGLYTANLFSPIFATIPSFIEPERDVCQSCGYPFVEYTRTGMLGCTDCYESFSDRLDDILLNIQGKNRHVDLEKKVNQHENVSDKKESKAGKIEKLREKIQVLIKEENYEEAAKVRDEIKKLSKE